MVKVGDAIPSVELTETSPGTKVNIGDELASGKGLIIGVPAAFSKSVSYVKHWHSQQHEYSMLYFPATAG